VFLVLVSVSVFADLECEVVSSCPNVSLLLLENDSGGFDNAHAEIPSYGSYANSLCCNSSYNLTSDCDGGFVFLNLSNETNAHVQDPLDSGVGYDFGGCVFSNASITSCRLAASCLSYEACLVSVSDSTNAHVSSCGVYSFAVCCFVGESSAILPVVFLESPVNFDSVSSNSVNLSFNVSSVNLLSNCSLIVDDDVKDYLDSPLVGMSQSFSAFLVSGSHLWSVNCSDVFNNVGSSEVWGVSVTGFDYYAVPFFILVSGVLFILSFYLRDYLFRFFSGFLISIVAVYVYVNGVFGVEGTFIVTIVSVILAGLSFYVLARTGIEFVQESWG